MSSCAAKTPVSLGGEIAGFGAHLEVSEPKEVRDHLLRIGRELSAAYGFL